MTQIRFGSVAFRDLFHLEQIGEQAAGPHFPGRGKGLDPSRGGSPRKANCRAPRAAGWF